MSKYSSKQKLGFTLIEMSVVLLIIGILAGIVLRNIGGQGMAARDQKRIADLNNIATQLVNYSSLKGQFPTAPATATNAGWDSNFVTDLNNAGFVNPLPVPPTSNTGDKYQYIPCRPTGSSIITGFVLKATLEQSKTQAGNLYKNSYSSGSVPSGRECNEGSGFGSTITCNNNNDYCYAQF